MSHASDSETQFTDTFSNYEPTDGNVGYDITVGKLSLTGCAQRNIWWKTFINDSARRTARAWTFPSCGPNDMKQKKWICDCAELSTLKNGLVCRFRPVIASKEKRQIRGPDAESMRRRVCFFLRSGSNNYSSTSEVRLSRNTSSTLTQRSSTPLFLIIYRCFFFSLKVYWGSLFNGP